MVFSIYAADNEFATSTGANVEVEPGKSAFDDPPNAVTGLVITTQAGDADPRLFEIGDTYDLVWDQGSITNAAVVRSDAAGPDGIIVFRGTNGLGQNAEVIWTPGFDLDNWYFSNFVDGQPPQFFNTDQDPAYTHEYICFERSTRIHTPQGLIPAGRLQTGDWVCTWSGRKQQIKWIGSKTVEGAGAAAPIRFDVDTIGNFRPVKLSPQHRVLISSPQAELMFGARDVLVPAIALLDGNRIRQVARRQVSYVHILLDRHDILIAEGAPCESLLPGWRTRDILTAQDREEIRVALNDESREPCRLILKRQEAVAIAASRFTPYREAALI
ncbi:Hint domain-containing protein [Tropicibacter naphthalenivorans]|uniref:Hedgehog/Intein (Hint) domain-containing protein n=1 Tax=Tropicibacter naphthalenivorans TaxID=441103 RepID=A0A0N7LZK5_9RHOB|nr:Hint domain-containing protein [Tropicibacter naphthalenivorans]CUH77921.1 hypothetical protein TRN7648_01691 [Tropicibacter naphthalenivorans]SMC95133.1 Hint domain-containing protein [Tropicibacter naphthalenivorans]